LTNVPTLRALRGGGFRIGRKKRKIKRETGGEAFKPLRSAEKKTQEGMAVKAS